jgi:hypothetical protein
MPKIVFNKLHHSSLISTSMCLQLADQSIRYPIGIDEDIPVKIRKFFILVDFVVSDMQPDSKVSLILGRPFVSTTNAHIDVEIGEVRFNINGQEECFPFKPKPELSSIANLISEEGEKQSSGSPSSGPTDTPEE